MLNTHTFAKNFEFIWALSYWFPRHLHLLPVTKVFYSMKMTIHTQTADFAIFTIVLLTFYPHKYNSASSNLNLQVVKNWLQERFSQYQIITNFLKGFWLNKNLILLCNIFKSMFSIYKNLFMAFERNCIFKTNKRTDFIKTNTTYLCQNLDLYVLALVVHLGNLCDLDFYFSLNHGGLLAWHALFCSELR